MKSKLTYWALTLNLSLISCITPNTQVNYTPSSAPQDTSTPNEKIKTSSPNSTITPKSPSVSGTPTVESSSLPGKISEATPSPSTETTNNTDNVKVASLKFVKSTNRFLNKQNEERQIEVLLLDADGNVVPQNNVQLEFLSSRARDITIDSNGKVKAIVGMGYSKITVRVHGTDIQDSINFDITDPSFFSSSSSFIHQPVVQQTPVIIPTITNLSINSGVPGQTLVINGTNFSNVLAENIVKFGDIIATIVSATPTQITIKIPVLTTGDKTISITTNNQTSTTQSFTVNPLLNFVINGEAASDSSGISVSSAGDVNGDGKSDIIIGAKAADPNGNNSSGRSYVVYGGVVTGASLNLSDITGGDGSKGFVLNGEVANDQSGSPVSSAGDVNGDGKSDIIIGASSADPNGNNNSGRSYVIYGGTITTPTFNLSDITSGDGSKGFVLNGEVAEDSSGVSVSSAGDVNGDGKSDIIIGANLADPNGVNGSGRSYVIYGGSVTTSTLNLSDITGGDGSKGFVLNGEAANDRAGFSVSSTGDINGDGKDDIIIGANRADPNGNSSSGRSYVVYGGAVTGAFLNLSDITGGDGSKGFVLNGEAANDQSGRSVSNAGDVNGDGKSDIIISGNKADPNGNADSGRSYIVYGGAVTGAFLNLSDITGGDGSKGFVLNGEAANDNSGISVSNAGDVNGDGKGDIIIGSNDANPNGNNKSGRSYVIYGGTITTPTFNLTDLAAGDGSKGFVLNGEAIQDESGISVSSTGDINGDGKSDIIIGSSKADPNGNNSSGRSYVIYGGSVTRPVFNLSDITTP